MARSSRLPFNANLLVGKLTSRLTLQLEFWVLITALPSLLLGGWLFISVYQELVVTRQLSAETVARQTLDSAERMLFERYGDTLVFSGLPLVRALDRIQLADIADYLVTTYAPYYRLALILDREGHILAANRVDETGASIPTAQLRGRSVSGEPWFARTLTASEPVLIEDFHPDPLVETIYQDSRPVMSFSAPIRNHAGLVVGVWSTRLSMRPLEEMLAKVASTTSPASLYALRLLAPHRDSPLIQVGPWPTPEAPHHNGITQGAIFPLLAVASSTGFSHWPGLHWRLEVYEPPDTLGWTRILTWLSVWLGVLVVGGVIGLGWIVHRRLISPLLSLTELARDRARLARTVPIERSVVPTQWATFELASRLRTRPDELGALMRTVEAMAREGENQVARLTSLNTIAQSFQREMASLPSLLARTVNTARDLTGARYAALGVFDETGERLTQFITAGMDETTKATIGTPPIGQGLLGHLAKEEGILRLSDLTKHPAFSGFPPHHPPMSSFMGVTIRAHGQLYGRLYLTNKEGPVQEVTDFTEMDEQVIVALAYQAGTAIENASLFHQTKTAETRYRAILDSVEEGIYGVALSGHCLFINRAGAARLGYGPDDLVGRSLHSLLHHTQADGQPCHESTCPLHAVLRTATPARLESEVLWCRNGSSLLVICVSTPLYDVTGTVIGAVVSFTDVTERRHLEEQLRQTQKMEAIGKLAGGIAHDFNNLLTAILGYSNLLLEKVTPDQQPEVIEIKKAGERAASLTHQLLAFSRKQVLAPCVLDLNTVVTGMERLLRRLIGEHIDLLTIPARSLGRVKVDLSQIEQVILNLALNARDAMPHGGRLTIETANIELSEHYCRTHLDVTAGKFVMLAVSDTGDGMDAETLSRCLEPFFTTKPIGTGTGLGLSTVYGITKQSGGSIEICSELGSGTTVNVYLPSVEEHLPSPAQPARTAPSYPCTETILLVEDDEAVRLFAQTVLSQAGYAVLEASTGEMAMDMIARHEGTINLLLTDVMMPGLNGRVLAKRLMSKQPDLRVLYLSGYAEDVGVHHGVLDSDTPLLHKPFTADRLAERVREVLDA